MPDLQKHILGWFSKYIDRKQNHKILMLYY